MQLGGKERKEQGKANTPNSLTNASKRARHGAQTLVASQSHHQLQHLLLITVIASFYTFQDKKGNIGVFFSTKHGLGRPQLESLLCHGLSYVTLDKSLCLCLSFPSA